MFMKVTREWIVNIWPLPIEWADTGAWCPALPVFEDRVTRDAHRMWQAVGIQQRGQGRVTTSDRRAYR